jgi:hypothetical protein
MDKSELKAGQKLVDRDGNEYVYLPVIDGYGFLCVSGSRLDPYDTIDIGDYTDELKEDFNEDEDYDIMSVFECLDGSFINIISDLKKVNWTKVWEREPEFEEISAQEAMDRLESFSGKKVKIVSGQ